VIILSESIPLSFEAVDNLSQAVKKMTDMLEKMGAVQEGTKDATEDATKATEKQGEASKSTSSAIEKLHAGLEVAKFAYEAAAKAAGLISAAVGRSNEAWDEQSKKTGHAASSLGSIAEANAKLEKAQNKVFASLGKTIDKSGVFQSVSLTLTSVLGDLEKFIGANSEEIAAFGANIALYGSKKLEELGTFVKSNSEEIARFGLYLRGVGKLVIAGATAVDALTESLKVGLYATLALTAEGLEVLTAGLITLIQLTGQEVPQAVEDMRLGLEAMKKSASGATVQALNKLDQKLEATAEAGQGAFDTLGLAATGSRAEIQGTIDVVNKLGEVVETTGKKLGKNLRDGQKGKGKARGDLVDPADAAAEARALVLVDLDRQILEAQKLKNSQLVIELERSKSLVELGQSLKEIKTSGLRNATQTTETLRIQLDYEQKIKDLEASRRADRVAGYEIEDQAWREQLAREEEEDARVKERFDLAMARIEGRYEAETEQLTLMGDLANDALGSLPDLLNNISESTSKMFSGFSKAGASVNPLVVAMRNFNKVGATTEQQQDSIQSGLQAGVGILSGVTESFVKDKRLQAGIEALINAAAATAAYATGNVPMGIGLTAAAAGYAAAAAFGGGGGSGGSTGSMATVLPSSGSGGGGGSSDSGRAQALNDFARSSDSPGDQPLTINMSFDGALFAAESPQAVRLIGDIMSKEFENMLRNSR